jgi:hypothetical protein
MVCQEHFRRFAPTGNAGNGRPAMARAHWLAMCSAPRDGRRIVVLYGDFSGAALVRWGVPLDGSEACWFQCDWADDALSDEHYAGWLPIPEDTPEAHGCSNEGRDSESCAAVKS